MKEVLTSELSALQFASGTGELAEVQRLVGLGASPAPAQPGDSVSSPSDRCGKLIRGTGAQARPEVCCGLGSPSLRETRLPRAQYELSAAQWAAVNGHAAIVEALMHSEGDTANKEHVSRGESSLRRKRCRRTPSDKERPAAPPLRHRTVPGTHKRAPWPAPHPPPRPWIAVPKPRFARGGSCGRRRRHRHPGLRGSRHQRHRPTREPVP